MPRKSNMNNLIGTKIVGVTNLKVDEDMETYALVLSNGAMVFALSDEEGNGVGVMVMRNKRGDEFFVAPPH